MSAAITEIKMSDTQSRREIEEGHKQSPEWAKLICASMDVCFIWNLHRCTRRRARTHTF